MHKKLWLVILFAVTIFAGFGRTQENAADRTLASYLPFKPGRYARADTGNAARVVLAELFTGAECGPCIAADLTFEAIAERYDRQTVAILSYHLHVPGPDPMTGPDSDVRRKFYRVRATPTILLDGVDMQTGGGSASLSADLFDTCKERIESRLTLKPDARLSGVVVQRNGDLINVSGTASVISAWPSAPKLWIALVEDGIRYAGANRIPYHNFVVRKFLGPAEGTVLEKGSHQFQETASLRSISDVLGQSASRYEKERSDFMGAEFRFAGNATAINPDKVSVVIFVQDAGTGEILQALVRKPE